MDVQRYRYAWLVIIVNSNTQTYSLHLNDTYFNYQHTVVRLQEDTYEILIFL